MSYATSIYTFIAFAFGLVVGSFLNVCIYRIPRRIFWKSSRSFCPHCEALIPYWHNIPLLSFVYLRGKTACCAKPISWQYPLVELFTGLVLAFLYIKFPFYRSDMTLQLPQFLRFLHASAFLCFLIACSVIDWQHMIIPDVLSLPMIALTPLVMLIHPELTWKSAIPGVLLGAGAVYLIAWAYFLLRRAEGIGMGDAKLMAAIGGWLGYQAIFPTFLFGSILGSVYGLMLAAYQRRVHKTFSLQQEVPFGPFLAFGACFYFLSPSSWLEWIGLR
jgi:leader peptidase (prepilin peptidase)/N-methyltransferase